MYVIRRTDQGGGYVAKPGHRSSYTNALQYMQKFSTKENAKEHCCPGNEVPVSIDSLIGN